jgi:hypothetical protein
LPTTSNQRGDTAPAVRLGWRSDAAGCTRLSRQEPGCGDAPAVHEVGAGWTLADEMRAGE